MNKKLIIFVTVIVLAGAAALYVVYPRAISFLNTQSVEEQGAEEDKIPSYTFTPIPLEEGITLPNLDHEVQFSSDIPEEIRTIIANKIAALKVALKDDPTNTGAWFDLGVSYHNANDYEGAREIWEFLIEAAPNDTTAYENLAKLYHFSLKDFSKAESYFKQSLAIDSESLNAYLGLFDLYRYSYKIETSAAADILNQAIAKFPQKLDLKLALGVYYRDHGNTAKAREVLEEGLNQARDANDVDMVAAFGQEIERLP